MRVGDREGYIQFHRLWKRAWAGFDRAVPWSDRERDFDRKPVIQDAIGTFVITSSVNSTVRSGLQEFWEIKINARRAFNLTCCADHYRESPASNFSCGGCTTP